MFSASSISHLLIYIPISVIGIWRWTYWMARKVAAAMYHPSSTSWPDNMPKPKVSLVTPVYNEDPDLFERAMYSWIINGVDEIIAVIDKSNARQIVDYERRYRANPKLKTKCRLLVTPKPGKRAALCDGIEMATGDIIALVDSDTVWDGQVLAKSLPCFLDEMVGGVTVAQRIEDPHTLDQVLFDMLLWNRYREEIPFLMTVGSALNCLSGRTAFYRRSALLPEGHDNLHQLRHEHFLGTRGVSGDDKRLTHLILRQGWHIAYAPGCTVYTSGLGSLKGFMKQRLRWTRNSWRADLRAVGQGWIWKHPALALFMSDRFIQPFFMLIGPVVFAISVINHQWLVAAIFIVWWTASRFVRLYSYFKTYPSRIRYLPAWIVYTYANALVRVYALATLVEHSWATRWHASRVRGGKKLVRRVGTVTAGFTAIALVLSGILSFVAYSRSQAAADVAVPAPVRMAVFNNQLDFAADSPTQPPVPQAAVLPSGVRTYTVRFGDNPSSIARKLGITIQELKAHNTIVSVHQIRTGTTLIYFPSIGNQQ